MNEKIVYQEFLKELLTNFVENFMKQFNAENAQHNSLSNIEKKNAAKISNSDYKQTSKEFARKFLKLLPK